MAYQDIKTPWEGWRVIDKIGEGGFGSVYEIERSQYGIQERAAMKVITIPQSTDEVEDLLIEGYDDNSITRRFDAFAEDIVREYGMMAQMKGNANIVYCDDYRIIQQDNGFGRDICIRMELLTPLLKAMDQVSSESQIIRFGMEMCNALEACQKRKVIHRDIKPQNIFVSDDGVFKMGDFGIARKAEKTTRATVGKGTYQFMAPEVKNEQPYGPTVDIYSLGLVMYWLLNNRRSPFFPLPPAAPTHSEEQEALRRRFSGEKIPAPKNGSKELQAIVLKACAFDPKKRYQTAREMQEDLLRLSGGNSTVTSSVPEPESNQEEMGDDERTVGPVFKPISEDQDIDDLGRTVGPVFKERRSEKEKRKIWPLVTITACLVAAIALVLFILPKNDIRKAQYTLMEDSDNYNVEKVLGSEYLRNQIASITFLDTTKHAAEDAWDVSRNQDGTVLAWVCANGDLYDLYIGAEGGVLAPENCFGLFANYRYLHSINFNGAFDTTNVTGMSNMFAGCCGLVELDVSGFDTSNVETMTAMFNVCDNLTTLDLSSFDTSNVTDMNHMFAVCDNLSTLDVSAFDTSNVTDMSYMFAGCYSLAELDVSRFDTSNVAYMGAMFSACHSLSELDLSSFDTENVTDISDMFFNCHNLTELDISSFNTSKVTNMSHMFEWCTDIEILDVRGFDTSSVRDMNSMFLHCQNLRTLDVSGFNTAVVENMSNMFAKCEKLTTLDVSAFDTSNVTDMSYMFDNCRRLTELDVSNFYTSYVTDMSYMFDNCGGLNALDVSNFNTSSVTNMSDMFSGCYSLTKLDVSGFDTSSVSDMARMFLLCENLSTLDVRGFDTSSVVNMKQMFSYCERLTTLDVSGFNTSNVMDMDIMFLKCTSLIELDVSSFDLSNAMNAGGFYIENGVVRYDVEAI